MERGDIFAALTFAMTFALLGVCPMKNTKRATSKSFG